MSNECKEMMYFQLEILQGMKKCDSNKSEEHVASLYIQKEFLETSRMMETIFLKKVEFL